jgi:hypothetical protein
VLIPRCLRHPPAVNRMHLEPHASVPLLRLPKRNLYFDANCSASKAVNSDLHRSSETREETVGSRRAVEMIVDPAAMRVAQRTVSCLPPWVRKVAEGDSQRTRCPDFHRTIWPTFRHASMDRSRSTAFTSK